MDNSNNPNWPNNPFSNPPSATPPSSTPPTPQEPAAFPNPTPASSLNNPWDLPSQNPPTQQPADSFSSTPSWPTTPVSPTPIANEPLQQPQPFAETTSPWNSTMPSQTPPQQTDLNPPQPGGGEGLTPSPLDNPWNTPVQAPASDNQFPPVNPLTSEPQQTAPLAENNTVSQPTWLPGPTNLAENPPPSALPDLNTLPTETQPPIQADPAPTDLSHLISNNPHTDNSQQAASAAPETLVTPPTSPEATATLPAEGYKGFPKWLIGVGVGLLIVVSGASAYFILGIGQPPKTASIPAAQVENPAVQAPAPVETPAAQPAGSSGNSANFGQLESNATPTPPPSATSAADLLRQRR